METFLVNSSNSKTIFDKIKVNNDELVDLYIQDIDITKLNISNDKEIFIVNDYPISLVGDNNKLQDIIIYKINKPLNCSNSFKNFNCHNVTGKSIAWLLSDEQFANASKQSLLFIQKIDNYVDDKNYPYSSLAGKTFYEITGTSTTNNDITKITNYTKTTYPKDLENMLNNIDIYNNNPSLIKTESETYSLQDNKWEKVVKQDTQDDTNNQNITYANGNIIFSWNLSGVNTQMSTHVANKNTSYWTIKSRIINKSTRTDIYSRYYTNLDTMLSETNIQF
jgi:hypothetical protein